MNIKKTMWAALPLGLAAIGAHAQSSVTLYGIIDTGIEYLNNSKGHSFVGMNEGIWGGERFGLRGREDLGGGTAAIFQLENGFNTDTGALQKAGVLFNRSSWIGLTNAHYGTLTAGRQYSPYYSLLAPWGPTTWLTGALGAHPGDIDNLDTDYRISNAFVYKSPTVYGFTVGAMYAFGGVPGSMSLGQSWSVAANYQMGGAGIGVGFERFNNATPGGGAWSASSTAYSGTGEQGNTAITAGYQTAAAQNRFAVTGGYQFSNQFDVTASYSNVQYIAGPLSSFASTAIFNTAGLVLHYHPAPAWDLAAGYAYTRGTRANGISSPASYSQINLTQLYSLSKRTRIYMLEVFQRANGQTLDANGKVISAVANIGEANPSSNRNQIGLTLGINHTF